MNLSVFETGFWLNFLQHPEKLRDLLPKTGNDKLDNVLILFVVLGIFLFKQFSSEIHREVRQCVFTYSAFLKDRLGIARKYQRIIVKVEETNGICEKGDRVFLWPAQKPVQGA